MFGVFLDTSLNYILQSVKLTLLLYSEDSCLFTNIKIQPKSTKKHNDVFKNPCDGLGDNELSTHFGKDKTKSIFCKKAKGLEFSQTKYHM